MHQPGAGYMRVLGSMAARLHPTMWGTWDSVRVDVASFTSDLNPETRTPRGRRVASSDEGVLHDPRDGPS